MYQSAHILNFVLNNKDGFQALIDINPVSDWYFYFCHNSGNIFQSVFTICIF